MIHIGERGKRAGKKITPFPRRKQRSYEFFRLIAMAGAILLCFFILVVAVQAFQYKRLLKELESAELKLDEYEYRNEKISEEIERLHEPGYIEILARKLLGLVHPGDIVFQMED